MMKTKSVKSKIAKVTFYIKTDLEEISEEDKNFIRNFNPTIYHNDLTCKLWTFDTKLPSGLWLENIFFNNELSKVKALILS